jgi:hypothetical protein
MTTQTKPSSQQSGHLAEAAILGLRNLFDEISEDVSQRRKCESFVRRVLTAYEKDDLDALDKQLSKEPEALERLYPKAQQILHELRLLVDRWLAERFDRLAQQLAEYSESKGRRLKGISPNFVVDGLIEVVLDKENKAAKVGASYIRTLDWERIRDLLDAEWERVWGRPFNAAAYRNELLSAYEAIMQVKPNPSGWVALNDVYQQLKEHREEQQPDWRQSGRVAGYYKDEFSADLSKLRQAQIDGSLPLPHIEFSAIRDPRRAYRVVLPDGSTANYGFLRPQRM